MSIHITKLQGKQQPGFAIKLNLICCQAQFQFLPFYLALHGFSKQFNHIHPAFSREIE